MPHTSLLPPPSRHLHLANTPHSPSELCNCGPYLSKSALPSMEPEAAAYLGNNMVASGIVYSPRTPRCSCNRPLFCRGDMKKSARSENSSVSTRPLPKLLQCIRSEPDSLTSQGHSVIPLYSASKAMSSSTGPKGANM